MAKRSKKRSSENYKSKRTKRTIGLVLAIILVCSALVSAVGFLSDGFVESNPMEWLDKEVNKDNLIKVENYRVKDGEDLGDLEVKVNEDGIIKINGKAEKDYTVSVANVDLQPGKYTISGVDSETKYGLQVVTAAGVAKAGTNSATFEIETAQTVSVQIYVNEGTRLIYKTFEPCLVLGEEPQGFFE